VHHCASCDRSLTTAAEAFVGVRPAFQQCRAPAAASGANKTLRPASLKQERGAARLVRKARLEFAQRACPCHRRPPRACRVWRAARPLYNIWAHLGQRDKFCPAGTLGIPVDTLYFDSNGCSSTSKSETREYGTFNTILMQLDLTNTTDRIGVTGHFKCTKVT
jgi:hypothetical protein